MCQCGGAAEHEHGLRPETVLVKSLHQYIDYPKIVALNALPVDDWIKIFTFAVDSGIQSSLDPQIILQIP